jgi:terminase B protein, putative
MKLEGDEKQWSDLFMIKYKNTIDGRIKIMPKEEMRKLYGKSPDDADALALTFRRNKPTVRRKKSEEKSEFIDPYTGEKRQRSLSRKTMELW